MCIVDFNIILQIVVGMGGRDEFDLKNKNNGNINRTISLSCAVLYNVVRAGDFEAFAYFSIKIHKTWQTDVELYSIIPASLW